MSSHAGGPILITGCSTGIGRASAIQLHRLSRNVVATARTLSSLDDLAAMGITTLALDVTDEESVRAAVDAVESRFGAVRVLINNAGYGLYGTVEQLSMQEIRRQFETNFFGLVRLTQLVLPAMRAAGGGRILNVSSMGGRVSLPGGAFYHASKYAVEALSDGLRMELDGFGIDVVLIEPGPVDTPWNATAAHTIQSGPGDPYQHFKAAVVESFGSASSRLYGKLSSTADDIAAVIVKAVTAKRPRTRYLINPIAHLMVGLRRWLPDRVSDAVLRQQYGITAHRSKPAEAPPIRR